MKKGKILALALAAGITFMGAGYAAWTDQVNVDATVSTGNLAVNFVQDGDYVDGTQYVDVYLSKGDNKLAEGEILKDLDGNDRWQRITKNNDYNVTCKQNPIVNKTVSYEFGNLFPGTWATANFKIKNEGTVPAAIENVTVTIKMKTDNGYEIVTDNFLSTLNEDEKVLYNKMKVHYRFLVNGVDSDRTINSKWVNLSGLQADLREKLIGVSLLQGEYLSAGEMGQKELIFKVPTELDGDQGENQGVQIAIKFDFKQSNLVEDIND